MARIAHRRYLITSTVWSTGPRGRTPHAAYRPACSCGWRWHDVATDPDVAFTAVDAHIVGATRDRGPLQTRPVTRVRPIGVVDAPWPGAGRLRPVLGPRARRVVAAAFAALWALCAILRTALAGDPIHSTAMAGVFALAVTASAVVVFAPARTR